MAARVCSLQPFLGYISPYLLTDVNGCNLRAGRCLQKYLGAMSGTEPYLQDIHWRLTIEVAALYNRAEVVYLAEYLL
jgi:hypothetical protein